MKSVLHELLDMQGFLRLGCSATSLRAILRLGDRPQVETQQFTTELDLVGTLGGDCHPDQLTDVGTPIADRKTDPWLTSPAVHQATSASMTAS